MKKIVMTDGIKKSIISGERKVYIEGEVRRNNRSIDFSETKRLVSFIEATDTINILVEKKGRLIFMSRLTYVKTTGDNIPTFVKHKTPTVSNTLWGQEEELLNLFPSIETVYKKELEHINKSSCTSCAANKAKSRVIDRIVEAYVSSPVDIPDNIKRLIDPDFSMRLARRLMSGKAPATAYAVPDGEGGHVIKIPPKHTHGSQGWRPSCLDCVSKHMAQALVLFQESEIEEYSIHRQIAIGHMAEAESESATTQPQLSADIRALRLTIMEDKNYKPDLVDVLKQIELLK